MGREVEQQPSARQRARQQPNAQQAQRPPHARRSTFATVVSWALVALWACFIFAMSANTGSSLSGGDGIVSHIFQQLHLWQEQLLGPDVDVVSSCAHFCEYTVFGALWANALRGHMPLGRACAVAIACASLYGVTDEFHQLFVDGRTCDPVDWAVDTAGAALGALAVRTATHLRYRRLEDAR